MDELLDDFEKTEADLVAASKGKRFANYFIDAILFYVVAALIGVMWAIITDAPEEIFEDESSFGMNIISMLLYAAYYFVLEGGTGGKTIGKYITKTRVTDYNGHTPSSSQFIKRSLSRIVPFDGFSFLGSRDEGWHDRWSDTMVIDEGKSSY